jgi:hypothetical protein
VVLFDDAISGVSSCLLHDGQANDNSGVGDVNDDGALLDDDDDAAFAVAIAPDSSAEAAMCCEFANASISVKLNFRRHLGRQYDHN